MTNCDAEWETVYFLTANSTWMAVDPADYLIYGGSEGSSTSICVIGIVPNSGDYFLAGDSFLRGFYSVHRMDDMSLGFVPHSGSSKAPLDDNG